MKKITIVCIAAATLFMMGSCGNKNKKAVDAVEEQMEIVVEEATECCDKVEECCENAEETLKEIATEINE